MDLLSKKRFTALRESWVRPDCKRGYDWTYDGVTETPDHWMGYNHELRDGLGALKSKSFDHLVKQLTKHLSQKPNVTDLMGGAYFLEQPEMTKSLTGIRAKNKDLDYLETFSRRDGFSARVRKIITTPNRGVIEADILTEEGWDKVFKFTPKANLLVCRPVGPFDIRHCVADQFDNPTIYCKLYRWLFDQATNLLDQNAIFFTEFPDVYDDDSLGTFLSEQDTKRKSKSKLFTVSDEDYSFGGYKRRYAVITHGYFTNLL